MSEAIPPADLSRARERLERDRQALLDLSLRNPLLNFKARSRALSIVGEEPAELHRLLVTEGRALTFDPVPEAGSKSGSAASKGGRRKGPGKPSSEGPWDDFAGGGGEGGEPAAENSGADGGSDSSASALEGLKVDPLDTRLQTDLGTEDLQRRLRAIHSAARSSLEEQGVNTLYLALGMLEWREGGGAGGRSGSGAAMCRAPLILIPVELDRTSARERFRLRWNGEDPGPNLSLGAKLKGMAGIEAPGFPESLEDLDVAKYFDEFERATADRADEGWRVDRGAAALGFFAFSKFLMFRDLDETTWPAERALPRHPVLRALLGAGFEPGGEALGESEFQDGHPKLASLRLVSDADASQTLALADAHHGRHLVIQGPPGTGKSQTITNLIAQAIADGKTVLFVAEKMAALEVVKRRLDRAGLGAACLELHSHKTRKKEVLDDLRRTMTAPRPASGAGDGPRRRWEELARALNAHATAMNTGVGQTGVTPAQAVGEALLARRRLGGAPPAEAPRASSIPDLAMWTAEEYERRATAVEEYRGRLARAGSEHPFRGCGVETVSVTEVGAYRERTGLAGARLGELRAAAEALAAVMDAAPPVSIEEAARLHKTASALRRIAAWRARGVDPAAPRGEGETDGALEKLEKDLATHAEIAARWGEATKGEAWELSDVDRLRATRAAIDEKGASWFRMLFGRYRTARKELLALCERGKAPRALADRLNLLGDLIRAAEARGRLRGAAPGWTAWLGNDWRAERSDPKAVSDAIATRLDWRARVASGAAPPDLAARVASNPGSTPVPESEAAAFKSAFARFADPWTALAKDLRFDPKGRFGGNGEGNGNGASTSDAIPFDEFEAMLRDWASRTEELAELAGLNRLARTCRSLDLSPLMDFAAKWPEAVRGLSELLRLRRNEAVLERATRERRELAEFDRGTHEGRLEEFRRLDPEVLRANRERVALAHHGRTPRVNGGAASPGGQLGVLAREFEKKSRHLPVRQLMARAGHAIREAKPVFLMSPLSVATYLPPELPAFDLVIFDEASQVRPVEAFGALARGRQAIVVGDSRQMPPTSFFDRLTAGDEEIEDPDDVSTADLESILGAFAASGAPGRMLRWHYRSRHESLIAVSNKEFYENRLVVFPSPDSERRESGLIFHHLPDTVYERGGSGVNRAEAEAVARAVAEFAEAQLAKPADRRMTLGVATFSVKQAEAVEDRLEAIRQSRPELEEFFRTGPDVPEPFFVKNLENVQGDERDAMFLSVGYGRDAKGAVSMNFGPLNADGGERRLNVLITRARSRCEVFSNLRAEDLDLSRTNARGVAAFRKFLEHAAAGGPIGAIANGNGNGNGNGTGAGSDGRSGMAGAVTELIESAGLFARAPMESPEPGTPAALTLGALDPAEPGRYRLGLRLDDGDYQAARSARDRDRIPVEMLRGLGWNLETVWGLDLYRDPEGLARRWRDAVRGGGAGSESTGDGARPAAAVPAARAKAATPSAPAEPMTPVPPTVIPEPPTPPSPPRVEAKPADVPAPSPAPTPAPAPTPKSDVEIPTSSSEPEEDDGADSDSASASGIEAYRVAEPEVDLRGRDWKDDELRSSIHGWLQFVARVEGPIHVEEASRRVLNAGGAKRITDGLRTLFERRAAEAVASGKLAMVDGSYLTIPGAEIRPRNRSGAPGSLRKPDRVAPSELAAAAWVAVAEARGMAPDEVPAAAARLIGVGRVSAEWNAAFRRAVEDLLDSGRLRREGNFYFVNSDS